MRLQVQVDQAVHKTVRYFTTYNQGVQEEVHSMITEGKEIAVPVDTDACKELAFEVGVRPEDVSGLDEPMARMGLPGRVVDVTDEKC